MRCEVCGCGDFVEAEYTSDLGRAPALECVNCQALILDETAASGERNAIPSSSPLRCALESARIPFGTKIRRLSAADVEPSVNAHGDDLTCIQGHGSRPRTRRPSQPDAPAVTQSSRHPHRLQFISRVASAQILWAAARKDVFRLRQLLAESLLRIRTVEELSQRRCVGAEALIRVAAGALRHHRLGVRKLTMNLFGSHRPIHRELLNMTSFSSAAISFGALFVTMAITLGRSTSIRGQAAHQVRTWCPGEKSTL